MLNDIALRIHTSELRDIACHMGSHSVTCHPTRVNAPPPNHSQNGWRSIKAYLPRRHGRLSLPSWLATYRYGLFGWSPVQVLTGPDVAIDWAGFNVSSKHSIRYMGDGFTGQKTQPTVSKYWRNTSNTKNTI